MKRNVKEIENETARDFMKEAYICFFPFKILPENCTVHTVFKDVKTNPFI